VLGIPRCFCGGEFKTHNNNPTLVCESCGRELFEIGPNTVWDRSKSRFVERPSRELEVPEIAKRVLREQGVQLMDPDEFLDRAIGCAKDLDKVRVVPFSGKEDEDDNA